MARISLLHLVSACARSESDLQADLGIPAWLPLTDAEQLLGCAVGDDRFADVTSSFDSDVQARHFSQYD